MNQVTPKLFARARTPSAMVKVPAEEIRLSARWGLSNGHSVEKTGFSIGADPVELERQFEAHRQAVQAVIPPEQLLVFDVKEGWEPLCTFLDSPVPNAPFPRSNHREEFWEKVKGAA